MLQKLSANCLLTIENAKTIIDAERPLPYRDGTLIAQFASGLRIMERTRVAEVIHDYREGQG